MTNWTLAARAHKMNPSVIREILKVTEKPGIISFAGGLPSPKTFPVEEFAQACAKVLLDQPVAERTQPIGPLPRSAEKKLNRLVLVHRLREVSAQVGFTRFDAALPDINGELVLDVELAPLSRDLTWLPANENRGEGVFLAFSQEAIRAWLKRAEVKARAAQLIAGFEEWRKRKNVDTATFAGLPYIMLQSLAHLLITALSLDCGYSASAIRERIYAGESGYGILLYTGTPGSEGSLGGLVETLVDGDGNTVPRAALLVAPEPVLPVDDGKRLRNALEGNLLVLARVC